MASLSQILRAAIVDKVAGYVEHHASEIAEEVVDKTLDDECEPLDEVIKERLQEMVDDEMGTAEVREAVEKVLNDM